MDTHKLSAPALPAPEHAAAQVAQAASIPQLVAEVYEAAPAVDRVRLLEQLLRPMGVLSLFGIAGGVFANIRFRGGWPEMHLRLEDIQPLNNAQIVMLVEHVQQISVEAVDGLAQWVGASPVLAGSAAAALLVSLLTRRAKRAR